MCVFSGPRGVVYPDIGSQLPGSASLHPGKSEPHHERKPAFCICENKDADQPLCFRYIDSTTPLLSKSKISSFWPYSVAAQPGLAGPCRKPPKTGFLMSRLK